MMDVKTAIETGDAAALRRLLAEDPARANAPIRWGSPECASHPLHFICDVVFHGTLPGEDSQRLLAEALIEAGADVDHANGDPLNAAASLAATEVAFALLDAGARLDLRGGFGETALHWAALLGNDRLVRRLIEQRAPLDVTDSRYNATPLGWALHGWHEPAPGNVGRHHAVVVALVKAGATIKPEWLTSEPVRARPAMLAALRGEPAD